MKTKLIVFFAAVILLSAFTVNQNSRNSGNQRAYYECSDPMPINGDLFEKQKGKIYFEFKTDLPPTNLKALKFQGLQDNPDGYFTAYLINTTDSSLTTPRQDGSLMMIQEALNKDGQWQPIEYWVYSGCGNSYFDPLELAPDHYVLIPIPKYTGKFQTKIRLKWKQDSTIAYSQPFEGKINPAQFRKNENNVNGILYSGPPGYLEN